jgi:hypothetical protein
LLFAMLGPLHERPGPEPLLPQEATVYAVISVVLSVIGTVTRRRATLVASRTRARAR